MVAELQWVNRNFKYSKFILSLIFFIKGLSRVSDGLLVVDCDLNLCRQMKDKWGFRVSDVKHLVKIS